MAHDAPPDGLERADAFAKKPFKEGLMGIPPGKELLPRPPVSACQGLTNILAVDETLEAVVRLPPAIHRPKPAVQNAVQAVRPPPQPRPAAADAHEELEGDVMQVLLRDAEAREHLARLLGIVRVKAGDTAEAAPPEAEEVDRVPAPDVAIPMA